MEQQTMLDESDVDPTLDQFFTDPKVARQVAQWTHRRHPTARRFLEPAAGRGAIVRALLDLSPAVGVDAWEIDSRMEREVRAIGPSVSSHLGDFLNADLRGLRWDGAVQNTPFKDNEDALFIRRSLEHAPWCVAILRGVVKHTVQKWETLWRWVDIRAEVCFVGRPGFGGPHKAKTDFVVLDMTPRSTPRELGEASDPHSVEWWP